MLYAFPRSIDFFLKFHRSKPDAVLVFASPGMSLVEKALFCAYARVWGAPTLLFLRGGQTIDEARRSRLVAFVVRWLLKMGSVLPCQGLAWHRFFVVDMKFDPLRCPLIPNWTATDALLRVGSARVARHFPTTEGVITTIFVGWVDESKGVYDLIRAHAEVCRRQPTLNLRLSIAGEGRCSAAARQLAFELSVSDSVEFMGWVKGDSLVRALENASIFCLPSYKEGLPNALIEAMAAALPVVVTPVGNIPDAVQTERQGLVVPPRDVSALAAAIERLALSAALRDTLGKCAFETARDHFSAPSVAIKLDRIMHELVPNVA